MRLRRSRLTDEQTERLLEHFVAGTPARAGASLVGVNRNTARLFYHRMRELISDQLERESPLQGEIAHSGPGFPAVERRRGSRRAAARDPVFGLFEREGKVYTLLLRADHSEPAPTAAAGGGGALRPDAIVYGDLRSGRGALDVSGFYHQRVGEGRRPTQGKPQINSVESFWSQCKRHLRRYNGIPRAHFHLFLKECEWRFNYGPPPQQLKALKTWIKTSIS
jgi:transposase